jgi:hypothetical protein
VTPEQRHIARVVDLGCVMALLGWEASCERAGQHIHYHHLREDQGAAQRSDAFLGVPFCWMHHLGPNGFHGLGRRGFETRYNLSELDLLAVVLRALEIRRQLEMKRAMTNP